MEDQNNIPDELRSLNSGLPDPNSQQNPFSVPQGYFDGLAAFILSKVKAHELSAAAELQQLSPFLAGLSKEMPYTLPAGYFEENMTNLPFLTRKEESVVLAAIGKELPYTVSQGYFENLPEQVLEKVSPPKAKVVPLFARKWMRAAVAAVVGGVILFGGYHLLNAPGDEETTANAYRPADTTATLVAKNERPSVVQDIKKASNEELDAFIKSVPLNTVNISKQTATNTDKKEVKELLKDVSVKEIDNFLEQLPATDEDLASID
jgi:hypothetical protein